MIVEFDRVGGAQARAPEDGRDQPLEDLLVKLNGEGQDLEALILEDGRLQRRAALAMRQVNAEARRRQVQAAAQAMVQAAWSRFGSAVVGCVVSCAAACVPGAGFAAVCCSKLAEAVSKFNPLDLLAVEKDAQARRLDLASSESSEGVRGGDDWLGGARELERRMFDKLEQIQRGEHEINAEVLGRLG